MEIDLNFLHRVPLRPVAPQTLWQPGGEQKPVANTMSLEEVCAGKFCALLDRSMPRDLYDAKRLAEMAKDFLESNSFRAIFIAMASVLNHPLYAYGRERLERVTDEDIRTQLYPMLSTAERPPADELREGAWRVISPFLSLTEPEREFTDKIGRGELEPELLFPRDPEMISRLRQHPALLWKVKNARDHNARNVERQH